METLLYSLFIVICAVLIFLILIQQGKGAGVGFSMGGASQAMFGGSGGRDVFIKITGGLAVAFVVICIILARMAVSDATGYHGALADVPTAPAAAAAPSGLPMSGTSAGPRGPMSAAPLAAAPVKPAPAPAKP